MLLFIYLIFFMNIFGTYENKRENQAFPFKYITLYKYECDVNVIWENPFFSATIWRRVWLMRSI